MAGADEADTKTALAVLDDALEWLGSDVFNTKVEAFVEAEAALFAGSVGVDAGEQSLEHFESYRRFVALCETSGDEYLTARGSSAQAFADAMAAVLHKLETLAPDDPRRAGLADYEATLELVLAMTTFEGYAALMRDAVGSAVAE
jgi:hypothetical protein